MSLTDISRFLSLILRHKPETIGITLDEHGWANVNELIEGISRTRPFDMEMLEEIVRTDDKQRYSFNEDKTHIRANQGHSIPVNVELTEKQPPEILYHGTGEKYIASIDEQGLIPKSRLYVHLSQSTTTAKNVGARHGKPVIYEIAAGQISEEAVRDLNPDIMEMIQILLFRKIGKTWSHLNRLKKQIKDIYTGNIRRHWKGKHR